MSAGWQASAFIGDRPATIDEVRIAIAAMGLDASTVEAVDEGVFLIPLNEDDEAELNVIGYIEFESAGVKFEISMP